MAIVNKRLCSGVLSDTNATLYTAPSTSGLITIVKQLTICNTSASAVTITLKLDGIEIYSAYSLAANTTEHKLIDQIIEASELIEVSASTADVVKYYVSGKEVV